jgi:copper chaperone
MEEYVQTRQYTWLVENIKCGGCAKTVKNNLNAIEGVKGVDVDLEEGRIQLSYHGDDDIKEEAMSRMIKAGYPPKGDSNLRHYVTSYVSCMKGRMSD